MAKFKLRNSIAGSGGFGLAAAAAVGGLLLTSSGCISDTDCGICDPDNLVLESFTGLNYANRRVHQLTDGRTSAQYFVETLEPCEETEVANDPDRAPRGAEEWCKISPLLVDGSNASEPGGIDFVFNNLLEPTSIELVRLDPEDPNLFEIYDWKQRIAEIRGPITRFNGDYFSNPGETPDVVTRSVNLSCIDNLRDQGRDFSHEVLDENPDICEDVFEVDDGWLPLKVDADGVTKPYEGETDWRRLSCSAPDVGADTCCSACDFELSVNVAKYGVNSDGDRRTPDNALSCSPSANVFEQCADFVPFVDRSDEVRRFRYEWDGENDLFRLPRYDLLRETHPDERPPGVEPDGHPCQVDADCDVALGSNSGAVCIGTTPEGNSCEMGTADCTVGHCKAEWFATCSTDNNLGGSFCVDKRFKDRGAGACFVAREDFQSCTGGECTTWDAGRRLALCDAGENPDGNLTAAECCQESLGGGESCDPLFQPNIQPLPRYDRDQTLPDESRSCFCGDPSRQDPACEAQIRRLCTAPWGDLERHDGESNEGDYVTRFVTKLGGVIYDPSLKGVALRPGDRGGLPRSLTESCAAQNNLIGGRNIQDGWRMHDSGSENYENFDRAMCSASEYTVVFATEGEFIEDKVGNTLRGKEEYRFRTPDFHVVPESGNPKDNLQIGSCEMFEIRVSNKYDLSPDNLNKIEMVELELREGEEDDQGDACAVDNLSPECWRETNVVAGGSNCVEDPLEVTDDAKPCMLVDTERQRWGVMTFEIDTVRFEVVLQPNQRYRLRLPGLEGFESFSDLDFDNEEHVQAWREAFHDVCGMPLITYGTGDYRDFFYDFTIDEPRCREDVDGDGVPLSCDNARNHFNPDQEDQDRDGFGDIVDLCVLTPSESNTGDSDRDGIGNDCDNCRQQASNYFIPAAMVTDPSMWVRNIPLQLDSDQDGIGDVCDNCVVVANCGSFGPTAEGKQPHTVGTAVPFDDPGVCQNDANDDMIGDACIDPDQPGSFLELPGAAGPVGFENADDFDQDGVNNLEDGCPRQPVAQRQVCTADGDCDNGGSCAPTAANDGNRYCNHLDSDNDGVGNICDTCPFAPNTMQVTDAGMQVDDEDGDFVGAACETNNACVDDADPRPYAFMEVSVNGLCCTATYPGDGVYVQVDGEDGPEWDCEGLCDPDGFPIQRECDDEAIPGEDEPDGSKCRALPSAVASRPGVIELPPGCEAALADAGITAEENVRLELDDIADPDELWGRMCFLPQWDQDFDGLGDACDLCDFAFDPLNEQFVDPDTGKLFPTTGRFCAGEYDPNALCAEQEGEGETGTGTGTDG